jgi:hypothetical protein
MRVKQSSRNIRVIPDEKFAVLVGVMPGPQSMGGSVAVQPAHIGHPVGHMPA